MSVAMPIKLLGEIAEKELTSKMSAWLSDLYSGWFSDAEKYCFSVTIKNKTLHINSDVWNFYGNSNKLWLAFKSEDSVKNKIMAEMFELESSSSLKTTKFTDAIYKDFIDSNVNMLFERNNMANFKSLDIKNPDMSYGSGAILATISNGSISLPIAISGEMVSAICGEEKQSLQVLKPNYQLVARESTFDKNKCKSSLEVLAGKVNISLRDFSQIGIGDVVLLDTKVGMPFSAILPTKKSFNIQLGAVENKKAIQFIE